MIGGLPGNAFVLMEFQQGGGVLEFAALELPALGLDFAELVEGLFELAGETRAMQAEQGEGFYGRTRVGREGGKAARFGEEVGFEQGDAVETPGGIGELVDELGFGGRGGLIFVEELLEVSPVLGGVLGREDGGASAEAVAKSVERRAPFTGLGAGAGGVLSVGAVDFRAVELSRCDCGHELLAFRPRGSTEAAGG